jgi:hypothetical protein
MSDQPIRPEELFSQLKAPGIIERECGKTLKMRAPERKVIRPPVAPGVK